MNDAVKLMLAKYNCKSTRDWENALREIIQELALLGLWRAKFFSHAAFYGGTALRIIYGLDRYSEDLDFSLLKKNAKFDVAKYCKAVEVELKSFGFVAEVDVKSKSVKTNIESAFIKANTIMNMIQIQVPDAVRNKITSNKTLKVKLEIDKDPPMGFETEAKYMLEPIPFAVSVYKKEYLFAGKLHAVLCRGWKSRVKARDWYDMVWYVSQGISVDLNHLAKRMVQTGHLKLAEKLTAERLRSMLKDKTGEVNIQEMKKEIMPFLKHTETIDIWSKDFFTDVIGRITYF